MKTIALIPARLGATRFPNKLLANLRGKTVIRRTYEATLNTGLFDSVVVVTDADEIEEEIKRCGGQAARSISEHASGTDRIAEIARTMDADVFVNVQGDEPFVQAAPLAALLNEFGDPAVKVASLVQPLTDQALIQDSNYVKVAIDLRRNALFFSRSVIPYPRDPTAPIQWLEHIGVYAFRKEALLAFTDWQPTPLECAEKVECLRFLEHGVSIRMVVSSYMGVEIDAPEDLLRAEAFMDDHGLV